MSIKRITSAVSFIVFEVFMVACKNDQRFMPGNGSMNMDNSNASLILIGLGFGLLAGFMIWLALSRKNS